MHHGHLDGAAVRQGEGQVLGVGEEELFLPDAPEGHRVDQDHLRPVAPPQGLRLRLARARQLPAAASRLKGLIWEINMETGRFIWSKPANYVSGH